MIFNPFLVRGETLFQWQTLEIGGTVNADQPTARAPGGTSTSSQIIFQTLPRLILFRIVSGTTDLYNVPSVFAIAERFENDTWAMKGFGRLYDFTVDGNTLSISYDPCGNECTIMEYLPLYDEQLLA